jgi:hypothetical protein
MSTNAIRRRIFIHPHSDVLCNALSVQLPYRNGRFRRRVSQYCSKCSNSSSLKNAPPFSQKLKLKFRYYQHKILEYVHSLPISQNLLLDLSQLWSQFVFIDITSFSIHPLFRALTRSVFSRRSAEIMQKTFNFHQMPCKHHRQ